jgi:hypothetical protein
MERDFNNPDVKRGEFVVIESGIEGNKDNGKLYLKGDI